MGIQLVGKSSLRKLKATRMWMARMYEGGLSITFAISVLAGSCESSGILFCRVCWSSPFLTSLQGMLMCKFLELIQGSSGADSALDIPHHPLALTVAAQIPRVKGRAVCGIQTWQWGLRFRGWEGYQTWQHRGSASWHCETCVWMPALLPFSCVTSTVNVIACILAFIVFTLSGYCDDYMILHIKRSVLKCTQ